MRICVIVLAAFMLMIPSCGPGSTPERNTAGLRYALVPPAGMALFADTGKTKTYPPGGKPVKAGDPRLVLTRSSKVFSGDERVRRLAAEQFIRDLPDLSQQRGFTTGAIAIAGMSGHEATAIAMADGLDVHVYCAKLFAADGTFTILAIGVGDSASVKLQEFRAAAATLTIE